MILQYNLRIDNKMIEEFWGIALAVFDVDLSNLLNSAYFLVSSEVRSLTPLLPQYCIVHPYFA